MKRRWLPQSIGLHRTMKRLPTTTLLATSLLLSALILLLPLMTAQAASLNVDGGVLQSWVFDVDIEPEPDATVDVTVQVREYAGQSGNAGSVWEAGTYELLAGEDYWIEYSKPLRDCDASATSSHMQTGGPFAATENLTHVLCVQQGQRGDVTLRTESDHGPIVGPTASTSEAGPALQGQDAPVPPSSSDDMTHEDAIETSGDAKTPRVPSSDDTSKLTVDTTGDTETPPAEDRTDPAMQEPPSTATTTCSTSGQDDESPTHDVEACPDNPVSEDAQVEDAEGEEAT